MAWPEKPPHFAEFLEAMAHEPYSRTFPESIYKTLMFLEHAGEVPEVNQMCRTAAVKNALEAAIDGDQAIETGFVDPGGRDRGLGVTTTGKSNYAKIYAWFRLVKLWSGMRFDDTKGTPNRSMDAINKRIVLLPFYVSKPAWLKKENWLSEGWKLWNAMGAEAGILTRDFMLPWPNENMSGFARKVVDYPIASALSQALFGELLTNSEGQWQQLLAPGVGLLWTERSERATIRTWAQAARIPEDVRKMIGCWRPSADESYERNLRCQKIAAHCVKENWGHR